MMIVAPWTLLLWTLLSSSDAFTTQNSVGKSLAQQPTTFRTRPLHFFGNNDESDKEGEGSTSNDSSPKKERSIPFFGRLMKSREPETPKEADTIATTTVAQEDTPLTATKSAAQVVVEEKAKEPESPAEIAKFLRTQATRARLEADRMDAELTLQKIEKLERKLVQAKTKGDSVEDLQRQLDNLQAKLRGEAPKPVVVEVPKKPTTTPTDVVAKTMDTIQTDSIFSSSDKPATSAKNSIKFDYFNDNFDDALATVENAPGFMKKFLATMVDVDYDTADDINATEVAMRITMISNRDYSFSKSPKPTFTQQEIAEGVEKINTKELSVPENFVELAGGNETRLAEYALEYEYYVNSMVATEEDALGIVMKVAEGEEWMKPFVEAINQTAVDRSIESLYPKCMRKADAEEPTMAQVQTFVANVLPDAKFTSTSKPEKVLGGYVLRGNHKYENGDDLIAAIDKGIAKTSLGDKMTVLYSPDFTVFALAEQEDFDFDVFDVDAISPILYITGPDIVRGSRPVLLSLTTAFGLATSWYLSIYPFLLNPAIGQRVEEQLAVADAGMAYNLDWLTELSVPFFLAFIGIQLVHEAAHRVVAGLYDMDISVPTIVPSLVVGTTSTVTTFKEPPKNKEAMFDFAVAGPLAGVLASIVALVVGSQLTLTSDPATLPALPLEILRQSTLGGGIIDGIIQGSLYIPDGAPMSGIMISLHPLAMAGYISLIINALALVPVGTTDGGRMAITLFGRPSKLIVGNLFLFALFLTGLTGSDLFLFYFSFVIAFQTGNEVPARNEVDSISFSRVVVSTVAFSVAFLSLVPFQ